MKQILKASALVVGGLSVTAFLLCGILIALSTLGSPIGLGLQQVGAAGLPSAKAILYLPSKPLPKAAPGTLTWVERVAQPEPDPPSTVWRTHSGSKTVVSWPGSCGRADRASVAFLDDSQERRPA
jgi:hypothetical protein